MGKQHKISKHGTLGEGDVSDAQQIKVSEVVRHCQDPNFKEFFGGAGELPPVSMLTFHSP